MNFNEQKGQSQLRYDNRFKDEAQRDVRFTNVQQVCDRAFFQRGNQWIDGRAIAAHVFGDQEDAVAQRLGESPLCGQGVGGALVKQLIPILAPMVLSWLAGRVLGGSGGGSGAGGSAGGGIEGTLRDVLGSATGGAASPGGGSSAPRSGGVDAGSIIGDLLGGLLGGGRR